MPTPARLAFLRKRLLIIAAVVFVVLGLLYGAWWQLFAAHYESTDDAYVHGNMVQVTPRIAGTIVGIEADDTQRVAKGSALIKLDATDTEIDLQQAQALLAQTVRRTRTLYVQNEALEADVAVRQANVERAQVDLAKAQNDLKRRQSLARSGGISGEEILHAETAVKAAQSGLAQARAELAASRSTLRTNLALTDNISVSDHPDVRDAASRLREAWLANARTRLPAPVDGIVAQRSAQVGQHVSAGMPLMTIVPLHQVWVEANFKEGQVAHMKPGQHATLTADLYGSKVVYDGVVQGVAAGTGSAFALLPAQNATGNWIKVVQRVPVRITLDPGQLQEHPLRVGLSMNVEVDISEPEQQTDAAAAAPMSPALETTVFEENAEQADKLIETIIRENLGE